MDYQSRQPGSYWQPAALSQPAMSYPTLPFGQPAAPVRRAAPSRQPPTFAQPVNPNMNPFFGVKSGDFGGAGPFGVKTGDFGMPGDTFWNPPQTINMGGGGMIGGQAGGQYRVGSREAQAAAANGASGGGGIVSQFQGAMDRANQANEARYQDALGGYQSRYDRGMGMLSGLGQQEAKDINEQYDKQAAQTKADLIGRGLGNSTVMNTMLAGVERERAAELGRLNDRVRQQAMNTDAGLSGDTLQFMERKTESGPDYNTLANLATGLGQAGYGAGGAGGGGGFSDGGGGFDSSAGTLAGAMAGYGYQSRGTSGSQNGRLAAARANYAARNATKAASRNSRTVPSAAPDWTSLGPDSLIPIGVDGLNMSAFAGMA